MLLTACYSLLCAYRQLCRLSTTIIHIFILYLIITFYPVFYFIHFAVPYRLYIMNYVAWFVLVLTLLVRFWNNTVIIHNTVKRGLSLSLYLLLHNRHLPDDG
jgi:hypothetical protein